ncbi:MAG TPA: peptidoglycan-associated lipoprotein Pal [Terriglobales bacterium]
MKVLFRITVLAVTLAAITITGACAKKKVAQVPPPPPPAPAAPAVSLTAHPDTLTSGQPAVLTWTTSNAADVTISGVGSVVASGSKQVKPTESTTYELTAKGPGGERETSARVTVTQSTATSAPGLTDQELFARSVKDVYFDYDKYTIRADEAHITAADAKFLNEHPNLVIVIEGHCDDRGSEEYNIALGDNRANTAKTDLVKLGIDPSRIKTISYGKEKPFCTADDESCWQQNRRDHFTAALH